MSVVAYQHSGLSTVTSTELGAQLEASSFFDSVGAILTLLVIVIPALLVMTVIMSLMGMMRDMMQPGGTTKVIHRVSKAVSGGAAAAAPALALIPYAGPAISGGAMVVSGVSGAVAGATAPEQEKQEKPKE